MTEKPGHGFDIHAFLFFESSNIFISIFQKLLFFLFQFIKFYRRLEKIGHGHNPFVIQIK